MASPVGNIVVRIGADLTELQRGVQKAQGHLAKLGNSMRSGINIAAKYAAAMAAAGAAITAALVSKAFDAIDAQAKLARQVRATNAGLETLTRAADLAGVEQQKMVMAVKRLDVAIGESIRGTATYKDAFDALGLSAQKISEMDADQRIKAINQALIENVPAAQRAQVAGVLFGNRVGVAVASISADEISRAREEVESLGLAVSEVDSQTIERLGDDISTLKEVFRGLINRIAVKLAPIVAAIAESMKNAAMESRGFESSVNSAFSTAMRLAGGFADTVNGLRVVFKGLELVVTGFGAVVASVFEIAVKAIFKLASEVNKSINFLIAGINKIPGVDDIEFLQTDPSEMGPVKFMSKLGDAMREQTEIVRDELHDMAMAELPSDKIEEFLARVKAAADKASMEANNARDEMMGDGPQAVDSEAEEAQAEADRQREILARKLDSLREYLMTESELEAARYQERYEALQLALENELVTEGEYQKLKEEMVLQHQAKLTEIERQGLTARQQFERMSMREKAKTISSELANITAGVSQHNRKMFELNKIAGIANAVVNAYEGISLTMKSYPYPINVGMAAAHAAAAFAQVSAIKSASFGGGSAPSIAGSTPAPPVTPVTSGAPSAQGGRLAVEGLDPSAMFSGAQMRELAERLQEHIKDGGTLVFV